MIRIENIKNKMLVPIKKYYVGIMLLAIATVYMMVLVRIMSYKSVDEIHLKLVLTLIYGGINSLVIKEVIDRVESKIKLPNLLYLLVPILMILVYFLVLNDLNTMYATFKYMILCYITGLLFLVIPFIKRKEDSEYYSYKAFISVLLTGLCFTLLVLGIDLTILSVSLLFEINIKGYIYFEIPIFIMGFIVPTLFLSLLPEKKEEKKEYHLVFKRILLYIIYPILGIYTVVLYAYFTKILVTRNWPNNILGNLIIFYSLISIFVLYFTSKLKNNKIIDKFINIYPALLILPIIMMFISFMVRINHYGVTEARYYGILCFIFVLLSIFIIRFKNEVKYILITLIILLFISAFGPLSSFNISKRSQEERLRQILINNYMLVDNKIVSNPNISEKDKRQIFNILDYFQYSHKLSDISFLPDNFTRDKMEEVFGFKEDYIIK